jgi:class 3 adenylate cyclase
LKVLVADDNPDTRQLIKDIVLATGHEVITAYDGPGALRTAQTQMPDLVILDVNMPGMTGFDVCAQLKSDEKTNFIPILMLTALSDVEHRVFGLDQGADDYLGKPFNPRELMARVETRLRAKSESDELRETQQIIRKTFERFVAPSVVQQLLQNPSQVKLGGKLQEVTVMFADMEGFTAISEKTDPETLLSILNEYHALIVNMIQQSHGTVDKFIGDGVMALFNTPLPQEHHALYAVETALTMRAALNDFHQRFEPLYRMGINVGIHTGMAVVGNVGTADIMDFTAVGDTVNIASRLQGLCINSQILISSQTYEKVRDRIAARPIGHLNVKNRTEPVMTYEVLDWS